MFDYAEVASIQLSVWRGRSFIQLYKGNATELFSLAIQKPNGEQQRWFIDSNYGPSELIAQSIIEGHAQYVALHPQVLWTQHSRP